ncbi:MAG: peptide chain release factor 3 [Rhodobacterales bacterium]|nr:peptide chain release factor 3 [Rhodobacterales bacterium]
MDFADAVASRRTFAIISHPDAGKTTLTEKLLLYGGALHIAGAVKSRKASRHALSDWMEMEKEKGISITSSVLQFDSLDRRFNLLDTPGHADFSEDTYRTLAAVDSAVMLVDNAKGVEARTLKLFEVCRLRKLPVMTFVNKMDRPGLDPLDLMDQVGKTLNIKTVPLNWPIIDAINQTFHGVYDRVHKKAILFERIGAGTDVVPQLVLELDDPRLLERVTELALEDLKEALELVEMAGDPWDQEAFLAGEITPFFFGSAMTNFGVGELLKAISELAPSPLPRPTINGQRSPQDTEFSGFIFKIQANMNPRHRDRIAFMRVVSGMFSRGMEVRVKRSNKKLRLSKPHTFMASERSIVDVAYPGDIVGLYDPGELRLADTLYEGESVQFKGIPRFAPEFFARIILKDPTKRKHLQNGLTQLSQEGTIQLFYREGLGKADPYLGAVGMLQFEVLKSRLTNEYNTRAELERAPFAVARWVAGDPAGLAWLRARPDYLMVEDRYGHPVVLSASPWPLNYALSEAPGLRLLDVSPN